MDLTTTARVKALAGAGGVSLGADLDAVIATLIAKYSAAAEKVMNRHVEATARTEQYDVDPGQRVFVIKGYPGTITTLKHATDRSFSGVDAIDSDNYYWQSASGILTVDDWPLTPGAGVLQVVYTAGMGATQGAFATAYPDVASAIDEQIVHFLQRKDSMGSTSVSFEGGSASHAGAVSWLPHVLEVLATETRMA